MLEKLTQKTLALGSPARIVLAGVLLLLLAGAVALGWRLVAPDYQVLFSELDAQDASAIVGELDKMKVAHQLQDEGRTILVESGDVYPTRLKLMSKGVNLRGTAGFELFSDSDFGMTEFAQKINYQRAMQGELARTIMALEEVRAARVHLVIPDSGLMRRGDSHGKASITITTRPNKQLQPAQVLGIQRLVAAAVPQIEPAAVTILDNRGVALNAAASDAENGSALAGGDARLDIKRQTEAYFIEKAGKVLDRAVGPGRAIVTVDVLLNHEALKVTQEQVLVAAGSGGEGAVVRSKQTSQSDGKLRAAAGAQASDAGAGTRNDASLNEVEFQHGKRIEQIVTAPGAIRRLSVGVVLPETLPPAQVQKLTEVVSMAVGLNQARGDAIAVYSLETLAGARQENQAATVPADPAPADHAAAIRQAATVNQGTMLRPRDEIGYTFAFPATLLLLAIALAVLFLRRQHGTPRLSDGERVRMLSELQEWLAPRPPGRVR